MSDAGTHAAQEDWFKRLGGRLIDVWFYSRGSFVTEPQVADDDTFLETVSMSFKRLAARYAMWDSGGGSWTVLDNATGEGKTYPSRAAAEMRIIHHAARD